jgi:hypothetical protein
MGIRGAYFAKEDFSKRGKLLTKNDVGL